MESIVVSISFWKGSYIYLYRRFDTQFNSKNDQHVSLLQKITRNTSRSSVGDYGIQK